MTLQLQNPHSVLAALERRPGDVVDIAVPTGKPHGAWADVVEAASRHRIPIRQRAPQRGREGGRRHAQTERSSAAVASVKPFGGVGLAGVLPRQPPERGLWLALDRLTDPHNVGAIFRSAAFFGVQGVILSRDRSAPLNATVFDIACGGLEHVPFAVEANLARTLDQAKDAGLWILGTSEHAPQDVSEVDCERPWLMVVGNEEKGLRRLTLDKCDELCRLTPRGRVTSLNVSVATGVLIAALAARQ